MTPTNGYIVAALYHFTRFDQHAALQAPLQALCDKHRVKGTLLLAFEGIKPEGLEQVVR